MFHTCRKFDSRHKAKKKKIKLKVIKFKLCQGLANFSSGSNFFNFCFMITHIFPKQFSSVRLLGANDWIWQASEVCDGLQWSAEWQKVAGQEMDFWEAGEYCRCPFPSLILLGQIIITLQGTCKGKKKMMPLPLPFVYCDWKYCHTYHPCIFNTFINFSWAWSLHKWLNYFISQEENLGSLVSGLEAKLDTD